MSTIRTLLMMIATAFSLTAAVAAQSPPAAASAPERRIALIIGNDKYADPALSHIGVANVTRDMALLERSFRQVGFDVELAHNATAEQVRERFVAFKTKAQTSDVAVIYFTGLGVQVDGADYLGGTNLKLDDKRPASLEAAGFVSLRDAAVTVQSARKFAMVMAESNRTNPWAASTRGFSLAYRPTELATDSDVVIFYGSQDGSGSEDGPAGGNGPFALAVARHMLEPGLEIGLFARRVRADVMRATKSAQRPQLYGELGEREFYFSGAPQTVPVAGPAVFSEQPRLALVIGNSDYNRDGDLDDDYDSAAVQEQGFAPDLTNTANDARDIRDSLARLKFSVDLVENADYPATLAALFAFEEKINKAGEDAIVVIYYAGHAIQVGGANFLVPVNAKLPPVDLNRLPPAQAEAILLQYALPLQTTLLGRLKDPSRRGLNLVILDSCREDPWERRGAGRGVSRAVGGSQGRSRGLGEVRIDLRRTAISFATKPGDVAADGDGRNSPYTAALKALVEEPGLSVVELLNRVGEKVETDTDGKQVPWTNSPALGRTCLGACIVAQ